PAELGLERHHQHAGARANSRRHQQRQEGHRGDDPGVMQLMRSSHPATVARGRDDGNDVVPTVSVMARVRVALRGSCMTARLYPRAAWPRSCAPASIFALEHDRMTIRRREFLRAASAAAASLAIPHVARAQSSGALLSISESGANSVDPHTPGANRGAYEVAWNCYDRLLSLQIEKDASGADHANATKLAPELAEEWNDNGRSVTFKLRRNATFHDGAPVTARDVKWSLDRAMAAGGNPKFQLSTGSLTDPQQTVVVDDHT